MQISARRTLATLFTSSLAASLTLGVMAVTPASAAQATDPAPAKAAAQWLVANLSDQDLIEIASTWEGVTTSGPSYGTSVDLAQALLAVQGDEASIAAITDAIEAQLDTYVGAGGETYSGSLAKVVALAAATGRDVTDFGGQDLLARLEARVHTEAPAQGRLIDASQWGDYANTIGQAFAARALAASGSSLADEALDHLLAQQCEAGFFRLDFARHAAVGWDAAAPDLTSDQSCEGAAETVDPAQSADTTALAVLQLVHLERTPQVQAALNKAAAWLVSQQQADGSFLDLANGNGANANTTGLAGWALAELGEDEAAAKAAVWLRSLQVVEACAPTALAGEGGAFAYSTDSFAEGARWGIADPLDRSQWVIADVQALPALAAAPAASSKDALLLPTFAQAGKSVRATVRGLAAGERACTTGSVTTDLVGTGSNATVTLKNARAGKRTITLHTATGRVSDTVTVLGKKKLVLKAAKSAQRGSTQKVTVRGLAAGEKVTLRLGSKKLTSGKASRSGVFTARVKVTAKRGSTAFKATGEYATRTGTAKVRIR